MIAATLMIILLAGCKNRLETYEPYSAFDDRMAAAEGGNAYTYPQPAQDVYADQFASGGDEYVSQPITKAERAQRAVAASANTEVPFSSSRGQKHAVNIGAYQD